MNIICKNVIKFESSSTATVDQVIKETISICVILKAEAELIIEDITLYLNCQSELDKCIQTFTQIKNNRR